MATITDEAPVKEDKKTNPKPTPTPVAETTAKEDSTEEAEAPAGITGFFKRLFSGGETEPEPQPPVEQAAEGAVAIQEPIETATVTPTEISEVAPSITVPQMQNRILDTIEISNEDLSQLASNRAEAVRAFLETDGEIEAARLFVIAPEDPANISAEAGEPRVKFNLE